MRHANGIVAAYKMVDTCAAEFAAETPYYYSVFGSQNEVEETIRQKESSSTWFMVRSVSDRVSSSTSVLYIVHGHLQKKDAETVIVNNNPETVTTDFRYRR